MSEVRLGIDVACRADHRASLADERGEFIWSSWKFRTTTTDLERLWAKIPDGASVTVILEPTRNAWVPLSAWLQARGATVILVPPEQSADLRDYYNKHTKTDRLDSKVLARLPLLHPEGLRGIDNLGPAQSLRRAVRHRFSLVKRRSCREPASRCTRRAARTGVGRFPRLGHRVEDRPGHLGEIRRSTGSQASRARPAQPRC